MRWPSAPLNQVLTPISRPVAVLPGKTYRLLGAHWYAKGLYVKEEKDRSEEHTSELQSPYDLVCRLLLEKKNRVHRLPVPRIYRETGLAPRPSLLHTLFEHGRGVLSGKRLTKSTPHSPRVRPRL